MVGKKNWIAFFLVVILLCPVIAISTLSIAKKIVQHCMVEKLEHANIQTIIVKKGSFVWVKMKKEILVNGKMFDIKSYCLKDDTIIFEGLYDEEEKAIINNIHNLTHKNNEGSLVSLQLLKILLMPSMFEADCFSSKNDFFQSESVFFTYQESAVQQYNSIFIPPPNF